MSRLPYPGLRAFRHDETDLFFGREDAIDSMLARLGETRFLAVLGASGSGKSSVVKTGLIDALEMGFLTGPGSRWLVVDFSPGGRPRRNLAAALLPPAASAIEIDLLEAFLSQGPRSLVEWCRNGNLPAGENLLVLVDQFEELFRYRDYAGKEEAEAFVALLLESAKGDQPIYVALTMRSEYLAACTLIDGLAEAINRGQFLTPRLTRDQCRSAITGPAGVCGFTVAPELVNRLLNDLDTFAPWEDGENSVDQLARLVRRADQLPLLQHALNRMWRRADTDPSRARPIVLEADDYRQVGGLAGALDAHAAEILAELGPDRERLVESIFKALTSGQTIADAVRRPLQFAEIVAATGAPDAEVRAVIEAFAAPGRNLLQVKPGGAIGPATVVDISHESLIRQWSLLREWLDSEANSAATWRRLRDDQTLYESGKGDLLRDLSLATAVDWWDREKPTDSWAKRYGDRFDAVRDFFEKSRETEERRRAEERDKERRLAEMQVAAARQLTKRTAAIASVLAVVAVAAVGLGWYAWDRSIAATALQRAAEDAALAAVLAKEDAIRAAAIAEAAQSDAQAALRSSQIALTNFRINKAGELADQPAAALQVILSALPSASQPEWPLLQSAVIALRQMIQRHIFLRGETPEPELMTPGVSTHTGEIRSAAFSPDGSTILTASADGTARTWGADNDQPLQIFDLDAGVLTDAAFSPDGSRVAAVSDSATIAIWDATTGVELAHLQSPGECYQYFTVVWFPDGERLAASCNDMAEIWSVASGSVVMTLAGHSDWVRGMAVSPDGGLLATASDDGKIILWSTADGTPVREFEVADYVRSVAFSPDGTMVVTGSDDATIRIWSVATDDTDPIRSIPTVRSSTYIFSVAFSPDGKLIVSGADDEPPALWSVATGQLIRSLEGHSGTVNRVSFSRDGRHVLTAGRDYTTRVWSTDTGTLERVIGSDPGVSAILYAADGAELITGSKDGFIRVWSTANAEVLRQHKISDGDAIVSLAYDPVANVIAAGTRTGAVTLWAGDAPPRAFLQLDSPLVALAFSPEGDRLAVRTDYSVGVWAVGTGDRVMSAELDNANLSDLAFTPDGAALLSGNTYDQAVLLSATTGEILFTDEHSNWVNAGAISPDGKVAATGGDNSLIRLWSTETGAPERTIGVGGNVSDLAFAPDGHSIAAIVGSTNASVFSTEFGWELFNLDVAVYNNRLAISPDGSSLAIGGGDGGIRIFDLPNPPEMISEAERIVADLPPLSPAQLCEFLIVTEGCDFGVATTPSPSADVSDAAGSPAAKPDDKVAPASATGP